MSWLGYVALVCLGLLILWLTARLDDWLSKQEK